MLAVAVMALFVAIDLRGSARVGKVELVIVVFKYLVLVTVCVGGLFALHPRLLSPSTYPAVGSILASVAVTFFAYEGFRVITNAAEEVDDPKQAIPAGHHDRPRLRRRPALESAARSTSTSRTARRVGGERTRGPGEKTNQRCDWAIS